MLFDKLFFEYKLIILEAEFKNLIISKSEGFLTSQRYVKSLILLTLVPFHNLIDIVVLIKLKNVRRLS